MTRQFHLLTFILWKQSEMCRFAYKDAHHNTGLYVLEPFWVHSKSEQKVQRFPICLLPHICTISLTVNISHKNSTFVTMKESTLIHHYHLKSIVYIRAHSWCCTFYRLGQIYNDIVPTIIVSYRLVSWS